MIDVREFGSGKSSRFSWEIKIIYHFLFWRKSPGVWKRSHPAFSGQRWAASDPRLVRTPTKLTELELLARSSPKTTSLAPHQEEKLPT